MAKHVVLIILTICFYGFSIGLSQNKRALLIGISDYGQSETSSSTDWCNIHGANDINLLEPTLKNQGFKVEKLSDKRATASAIRKKFQQFEKSIKPGDLIYLHFSCHGQPFEDLSGDEEDGWDEALIPYDAKMIYSEGSYEGKNHILDDEIHDLLFSLRKKAGRSGMVYVIVDACHAGSFERGEEEDEVYLRGTTRGFSKTNKPYHPKIDSRPNISVEKNPDMSDICLLEACRSYQSNYEIKQEGKFYGPLSYYVNKTISSMELDKNIRWIELVKKDMSADRRLIRQNMVIETSIKL